MQRATKNYLITRPYHKVEQERLYIIAERTQGRGLIIYEGFKKHLVEVSFTGLKKKKNPGLIAQARAIRIGKTYKATS